MRKIICALLMVLFVSRAFAQEPNYELADRFSAKKVNNMVFSTMVMPNWFENSDKFWYKWQDTKSIKYYIVDPVAKTKVEAFDMSWMAMRITEIVKDPFDAAHIPFKNLKLKEDKYFTFEIESTIKVDDEKNKGKKKNKIFEFEYNYITKELKDVTDNERFKQYPRWANISPDGKKALYVKNHNLWWMDISELEKLRKDDKDSTVVEHQITTDGIEHFGYGGDNYHGDYQKDSLERRAIRGVWSPDANYFATIKVDMRHIKEFWVINSLTMPRPELETYKYQMPGEPGPKEQLLLFDMNTLKGKEIKAFAYKDQELELLGAPRTAKDRYCDYQKYIWLGNNTKLYIKRHSRDLKRLDLCELDVNSDSLKTIVHESLNTYVEFQTPDFVGTSGESDFVFWSERNGWANLYLYGADGTMKSSINDAPYHVSSVLHVDKTSNSVIYTANGVVEGENPYYAHIYKSSLNGGAPVRLDSGDYHTSMAFASDNGKFIVNNKSRVDAAPIVELYDNSGKKLMELEKTDMSLLFAAGYKYPEQFKVKAADGITDLWGVMYKPFDFDSTKVYPIIDYVYPGPQVEGNNIAWSKNMTRVDRLAQIGFVVITVGNRGGHPDRSKWYHNYGYGNLRDYGLEDQKYAIQQLSSRYDFLDINRVGIHGHSGGGFMSTAAILKYPDFFKVAVSCAGNHDNSIYNRWWSEQHHGILEEINAEGDTTFKYSIKKNHEIASNLKGHLMLVHGDMDDNVNPAGTIRVINALIRANKRFDMLFLPGQRHGFGDMNEYFFWRMADYYSEWLLGKSKRSQVDVVELNND